MAYSFAAHLARFGPDADYPTPDLAAARSYCARLTRSHYENFTVASALLPRRLVPHFYPIYAYCRWADDLGDETGGGSRALELLNWWRRQVMDCYAGNAHHPVMVALRPTIERFGIPPEPFLELLRAFEQDQRIKEYATFDELLQYCRNSANPVGRLVLYLGECCNPETAELSDSICTGLQLANFWQDVRRDYDELGRIYLPAEDRQRFGYSDADLAALRFTPAFREMMRFEGERARELLERGRPLLEMVSSGLRISVELFLEGGLAILRKIEAVDFDVWKARPKLRKHEKARLIMRALAKKSSAVAKGERRGVSARWVNSNSRRADAATLADSFAYCHQLTRRTARNFYYAFLVLPRAQRRAMDALYAFMRVTDDLADEPGEISSKREALQRWRQRLDRALVGDYSHPLHPALHDIVETYRIPSTYLHEVIDGVTMDLEPVRFETFDDLRGYCYRVASAVGLACIHIWGFRDEKAKEYAEAAGIALQMTNILRDLGEDLDNGRVYLPQEDLDQFACPPESWRERGDNFRRLMMFQVDRARDFYRQAEPLAELLTPAGRGVFQIMTEIYRGILEEIVRRGYDVFSERVRLSRWRKLRALLAAFPVRWGWL